MQPINFNLSDRGFHIEGFPNATKVIAIDGPKAKRLADLQLHKADFNTAFECLAAINETPMDLVVVRQALWESAIVLFVKCFGENEARFSLDYRKLYADNPQALEAFEFIRSLRNKNLVHDENSYTQCLPGAIINRESSAEKIAQVICLSIIGHTLGEESYGNLHLLLTQGLTWIVAQFDTLCDIVKIELTEKTHQELLARPSIEYIPPKASDVHNSR